MVGYSKPSMATSYPSISDLSANLDDVSFKSLTVQKLMASHTFNSIDILLQVIGAAEEAMRLLKESSETIPTYLLDLIDI